MLQSSCLPFVLYASQRIACYFCTMKRFLLITIAAIFCSSATVCAQFNTVTQTKVHRKAVPKTTQSQHPNNCSVLAASAARLSCLCPITNPNGADRPPHGTCQSTPSYLCHQPFGYRRDPFTKRKALHNGLDLKANYEPTYAMMHGEVIKVGKDKRSGLYVTLRHGDFTVSYCHLSQTLVTKGTHVRPGIIIALTGNSGRSTGPHLHLTLKDTKKDEPSTRPFFSILSSIHSNRTPCLLSFTSPLPHCNNVLNI